MSTTPQYGTINVTYRDGSEQTYVTYMSHLVQYEMQYGEMGESSGITATARLAHLVAESDEPFDAWLKSVAYVTVPQAEADGKPAAEPVPTP